MRAQEGGQDSAEKVMLKVMLQQRKRKMKLETPAEKAGQPEEGGEDIKHQSSAPLSLKPTSINDKACGEGGERCCRISEETSKICATD